MKVLNILAGLSYWFLTLVIFLNFGFFAGLIVIFIVFSSSIYTVSKRMLKEKR